VRLFGGTIVPPTVVLHIVVAGPDVGKQNPTLCSSRVRSSAKLMRRRSTWRVIVRRPIWRSLVDDVSLELLKADQQLVQFELILGDRVGKALIFVTESSVR
jgi:hypothetical protein